MPILFVVDDNKIDRYIIKFNITRHPQFNDVSYYDRGLPLLRYLKEQKNDGINLPDAIFLDLNMPEYDGWKVLDAINAIYPMLSKAITIYIVSVSIFSGDINQALSYAFVKRFISKPITNDNLLLISKELEIRDVH